MSENAKGLYQKYEVRRVDGKPMPRGCIVLEWDDPNAWMAIQSFASELWAVGYKELADELNARRLEMIDEHMAKEKAQAGGEAAEIERLDRENAWLNSKVAQNALDHMMCVDPDEERKKMVEQIHRYYAEINELKQQLERQEG